MPSHLKGLHDPEQSVDNCGMGFYCSLEGENVLPEVSIALACNKHRGAIGADGKTGDGAGLLVQVSEKFFKKILGEDRKPTYRGPADTRENWSQ